MDKSTNLTMEQKKAQPELSLEDKKAQLEQQQKEIEANFHRVSGAIALLTEMINEQEKPNEDGTT